MIGEDVGMRINWGLGLAEVVSKQVPKTKQCVLMEVMGGKCESKGRNAHQQLPISVVHENKYSWASANARAR